MQGVVVFIAEGVLHRPNQPVASAEPIPNGIALYKLMGGFATHVVFDTTNSAAAEHWCKVHGLKGAIPHVRQDTDFGLDKYDEYFPRQLTRIRAQGPIWTVVTASPFLAQLCSVTGVYSLTFNRPESVGTEPALKPWADHVEQVRNDVLARADSEGAEETYPE